MYKLYQKTRAINRIAISFALLLACACTASAYTIVMRGGKRVEIPAKFEITATTLTYEAGPDIQITLQLAAIDIPATEKANNETAGSLLRRMADSHAVLSVPSTTAARRTITNSDLEASMVRRRQSEVAYERRRQELGLPGVAESRRRAELESVQLQTELAPTKALELESESYWRARAASLRSEIAALDAEINYLRVRLEDSPFPFSGGFTSISVPFIASGVSFGNAGFRSYPRSGISQLPPPYGAPRIGPRINARAGFGGGHVRGQVWLNSGGGFRHARSLGGIGFPFPLTSSVGAFGSGYDYGYDRSALITRFNELAATRAGMNARWRELEDEARRAGAQPGWLRP